MDTVEKVIFEYHLALSQKENQKRIRPYQKKLIYLKAYLILCIVLGLCFYSFLATAIKYALILLLVISWFPILQLFRGHIGTKKWKIKVTHNMHEVFRIKKEILFSTLKQENLTPQLFYTKLQKKERRRIPLQNVLVIAVSVLSTATAILTLLTNNLDFSTSSEAEYAIHVFLMIVLILYVGMLTYTIYSSKAYFEYPSMEIYDKKEVYEILKLLEDNLKY